MRRVKKRMIGLVAVVLTVIMTVSGCVTELQASDTVATVNGIKISADVANFYARYVQAGSEAAYAGMFGGGEAMWKMEISEGFTYADSTKDGILNALVDYHILEERMADYGITISAEENEKITAAAKAFLAENDLAAKEMMMANEESVARMLTLYTIESKMYLAMTEDVDTDISDEEAAQKAMQYVSFPITRAGDEATEEEKQEAREKAEAFLENAKTAEDFEAYAEEEEHTAYKVTFDKDGTSPAAEVVAAADELEEGTLAEVIETATAYYVVKLISLLDEEATDAKKDSIVFERKQAAYEEIFTPWREEAEVEVDIANWMKIDFLKKSVNVKEEAVE